MPALQLELMLLSMDMLAEISGQAVQHQQAFTNQQELFFLKRLCDSLEEYRGGVMDKYDLARQNQMLSDIELHIGGGGGGGGDPECRSLLKLKESASLHLAEIRAKQAGSKATKEEGEEEKEEEGPAC